MDFNFLVMLECNGRCSTIAFRSSHVPSEMSRTEGSKMAGVVKDLSQKSCRAAASQSRQYGPRWNNDTKQLHMFMGVYHSKIIF